MQRVFWSLFLTAMVLSLATPTTLAQADVMVVGEHTITVVKNGRDATASVQEKIFFTVTGDQNFTGVLTADLDPQALFAGFYFTNDQQVALGSAGGFDAGDVPNETQGEFVQYSFDVAAKNLSFAPGETFGLVLLYTVPGDDGSFSRRFDYQTDLLRVVVGDTPGLAPNSTTHALEPQGRSWTYGLQPGADASVAAGGVFSFTWEEVDEPREPLSLSVSASGRDPVRLRATATGGIAPYTYSWDVDGDGTCETPGQVLEVDASNVGTHRVAACVTDSSAAAPQVMQTYETRTIESGPTETSPTAWLLGLVGLVIGALLVFGLVQGGILAGGGRRAAAPSGRPSIQAETREMLQMRQRVMVAALKELEIAKKKGEVPDGLYTPLKAELKQDTVRVMRELEKRKGETV